MATIITQSELLTRAVRYITENIGNKQNADIHRLVDEAAMRFNLSPKDTESLLRIMLNNDTHE